MEEENFHILFNFLLPLGRWWEILNGMYKSRLSNTTWFFIWIPLSCTAHIQPLQLFYPNIPVPFWDLKWSYQRWILIKYVEITITYLSRKSNHPQCGMFFYEMFLNIIFRLNDQGVSWIMKDSCNQSEFVVAVCV